MRETIAWLALEDCESEQEDLLHRSSALRQEGTCKWILEHRTLKRWLDGDEGHSVVWIKGKPGSGNSSLAISRAKKDTYQPMLSLGKSVLASHVVGSINIEPAASIIPYFCSFNQERVRGIVCTRILRYAIARLLRDHQYLLPYVYDTYATKSTRPSTSRLRALVLELLAACKITFFVIDGLDECDEHDQKEVMVELLKIANASIARVKILFFSQESSLIKQKLNRFPQISLSDEEEFMSKDIETFAKASLSELRQRFEGHFIDNIEQTLIEKADGIATPGISPPVTSSDTLTGMFLWVRLVVANLDQQQSVRDLEEAAERLPDGLLAA
jgi:hypothetical protein